MFSIQLFWNALAWEIFNPTLTDLLIVTKYNEWLFELNDMTTCRLSGIITNIEILIEARTKNISTHNIFDMPAVAREFSMRTEEMMKNLLIL